MRGGVGSLARRDAGEHLGLGEVDELVRQAFEAVGQRPRLRRLDRARLGDPSGAEQFGHPRDDAHEPVVRLPHLAGERDVIIRVELQSLKVVAELVELAERRRKRPVVGQQQSRGDVVKLHCRVLLHLPVGCDLALQSDQIVGAAIGIAEYAQSNGAQHDQ